jgi:hypothetical protein
MRVRMAGGSPLTAVACMRVASGGRRRANLAWRTLSAATQRGQELVYLFDGVSGGIEQGGELGQLQGGGRGAVAVTKPLDDVDE